VESLLRRDDVRVPGSTSHHVIFESPRATGAGLPSSRGVGTELSDSTAGSERSGGFESGDDCGSQVQKVTSAIVLEGRQLRKDNEAMRKRLQKALDRLELLKRENHRLLNAIEETEKAKREISIRQRLPQTTN
jgi:hypothetical protein